MEQPLAASVPRTVFYTLATFPYEQGKGIFKLVYRLFKANLPLFQFYGCFLPNILEFKIAQVSMFQDWTLII